jgi:hypothetical protein
LLAESNSFWPPRSAQVSGFPPLSALNRHAG